MTKSYIINDVVIFYPDEHRLVKKDDPNVDLLLNIPASRCLALLIERKGGLITQKEFFADVWEAQGTYVTQNTFYQNISLLRKGLKAAGLADDPIKTVIKRGMALADTISVVPLEDKSPIAIAAAVPAPVEGPIPTTLRLDEKPARLPVQLKKKWLCLLLIALFAIFSVGYYQEKGKDADLLFSYKPYADINGCKIMIPSESKITDIFSAFLKENPPTCPKGSVAYLTTERDVALVSIIQCSEAVHNAAAKCHSIMYEGAKGE